MGQNDNQFYQMESKDDNFVDDDIAIHLLVREYYKEHLDTGEYIAYLQRERDCRAYHTGMIQSRKEGVEEGKILGKQEGIEEGIMLGKEEGIRLGKEEGILEVKRDCVLMIFKKEFPYEDTHFLENLSIEQYDAIMKLLSENGSLEQIHEVLKK
ncbi:hypothetical protein [Longibaculum muris]|uniref:hypothetical protein n=1 Tax=Longibaculum muris TaxID=1796628 RepID=UPI0022E0F3EA|nr:hypothetical protein [Longibaculum muris]